MTRTPPAKDHLTAQDRVNERLLNCVEAVTDEAQIKPEYTILGELGADSLEVVELMLELEDEFDIEIDDANMQRLSEGTVGGLYNYIEKAISAARSRSLGSGV